MTVEGTATLSKLNFPFWIVTQRRGLISSPVEPEGISGFIAAFTRARHAASFIVERGEMEWENRLVARPTLASLLEDFRRLGLQGFCVDPVKGECGMKIAFDEMETF